MDAMKTCATCKHWMPYNRQYPMNTGDKSKSSGGLCRSVKLAEDYGQQGDDMLLYSYQEGGEFWTGPKFGCVHHAEAGDVATP